MLLACSPLSLCQGSEMTTRGIAFVEVVSRQRLRNNEAIAKASMVSGVQRQQLRKRTNVVTRTACWSVPQ